MSKDKEFNLFKHGQTSDNIQLIESGLSLCKVIFKKFTIFQMRKN
jgi:hypothetical protein